MKKRFLSLLIVLCFSLSSPTAFAEIKPDVKPEAANQQESSSIGDEESCTNVLSKAPKVSPPPGLSSDQDQQVSVILTESFAKNSPYSCGRIVQCLREQTTGERKEAAVWKQLVDNYSYCIVFGKDGIDLLTNYARMVYQWIAGIVGAICILVIILSGIQISIGGLSQEEVSSAKDRVVRALVGLVVLFLSAFILYTINPFFFNAP